MINFIYLAHGNERYRRQAVFSILSYKRFLDGASLVHRFVVFTDEPQFFEPLQISIELISETDRTAWMGEIDFVHRMKIAVMIRAAEKFGGNLFFIDSDNYALADPVSFLVNWNSGTAIMEKLEYKLARPANRMGKQYRKFFLGRNRFTNDYEVSPDQPCWNSGIIGIPEEGKKLLPDILTMCDAMHHSFPKHLSEQMAFSIVLNKQFHVEAFKPFTFHWFGHGQAINRLIEEVLADYPSGNLKQWITDVANIKTQVLKAPLNPDKQPWYKRWFSR